MTDVDINYFGDHDKTDSHPDEGDNIPLNPGGVMGGSTWEPECKQETLFGGARLMTKVLREHVEALLKAI